MQTGWCGSPVAGRRSMRRSLTSRRVAPVFQLRQVVFTRMKVIDRVFRRPNEARMRQNEKISRVKMEETRFTRGVARSTNGNWRRMKTSGKRITNEISRVLVFVYAQYEVQKKNSKARRQYWKFLTVKWWQWWRTQRSEARCNTLWFVGTSDVVKRCASRFNWSVFDALFLYSVRFISTSYTRIPSKRNRTV